MSENDTDMRDAGTLYELTSTVVFAFRVLLFTSMCVSSISVGAGTSLARRIAFQLYAELITAYTRKEARTK